jgi:hypothetical protein
MKEVIALLILVCGTAHGYTVSGTTYTTNGSRADVQSALKIVPNDGIVVLPSGTFTWNSGVIVGTSNVASSNGGITIQGAGVQNTTLIMNFTGSPMIWVQNNAKFGTRITGIYFGTGANATANNSGPIEVYTSPGQAPYRIDNCIFDGGPTLACHITIWNNGPGLIDHCNFIGGGVSEMIRNAGFGPDDGAKGWTNDIIPGSGRNGVCIENCTFTETPLGGAVANYGNALQNFWGAVVTFRYNLCRQVQVDAHGTLGQIGTRWYEIYNNIFVATANFNQANFMQLRAGSGVVFNNVLMGGPNAGAGTIDIYYDYQTTGTYAGPYQPGVGISLNGGTPTSTFKYSPLYLWNNTTAGSELSGQFRVSTSTPTWTAEGRDYFVSATQPSKMQIGEQAAQNAKSTYNYTPYVYPHPLDHSSTSIVGPVSLGVSSVNLTASAIRMPTPPPPRTSSRVAPGQ